MTRRLDDLARQICKRKNDYTCQRCGFRDETPAALHWAHIERRAKKAIRWEESNSLCLCPPCHYWFDSQVTMGRAWLALKFPETVAWLVEEIDGVPRSSLLFRGTTIQDLLELEQQLKSRLKELEDGKIERTS